MEFILSPWTLSAVLAAGLVIQSLVLSSRYQRKALRAQAKVAQMQQLNAAQIEQARKQIGQLQHDLSATRLQLKRSNRLPADVPLSVHSPAREALERAFDSAPTHELPRDGFAETQPSRQFTTQHGDLIFS